MKRKSLFWLIALEVSVRGQLTLLLLGLWKTACHGGKRGGAKALISWLGFERDRERDQGHTVTFKGRSLMTRRLPTIPYLLKFLLSPSSAKLGTKL